MAITNYICRYCLILVASIIPEGITSFVHKYQFISKERLTSTTTIFAGSIPTWTIIESSFGETLSTSGVICIDSVLEPKKQKFSTKFPTLFRERHGWCPYSERVWLALELQDIKYDTIRIDNTGGGRPSYYSGETPQMIWPENNNWQSESLDLVKEIDNKYNAGKLGSNLVHIQKLCDEFRKIFPSRSRPSSRAAFLFQYNGEPLWKTEFEKALKGTDDLLSDGKDGPFFGGSTSITIADIAWAPFLERYRYQLPCLHNGLEPYDHNKYPYLSKWYDAMDRIPSYICRVKGDASSWRKVLSMAGFGNSGIPPIVESNMDELIQKEIFQVLDQCSSSTNLEIWKKYAKTRPYVAASPNEEAALIITRNRNAIIKDAIHQRKIKNNNYDLPTDEEELNAILRELVHVLCTNTPDYENLQNAKRVGAFAAFLDERMCVPRDMGCLSAAHIKKIAYEISTY